MKILATSDLHAHDDQMAWVTTACHQADLLLLAGDLLNEGEGRETVGHWLRQIPCRFALASGNHDVMFEGPYWLHDLRSPSHIIDEAGEIGGVPVCALPWQCDDGNWHAQAEANCAAVVSIGKPWILLTHSITPHGATRRAAEFENSVSARLAFAGHTHIPGWKGPWVTCGQTNYHIPNHVWLDWDTSRCTINIHHAGSMMQWKHSLTGT